MTTLAIEVTALSRCGHGKIIISINIEYSVCQMLVLSAICAMLTWVTGSGVASPGRKAQRPSSATGPRQALGRRARHPCLLIGRSPGLIKLYGLLRSFPVPTLAFPVRCPPLLPAGRGESTMKKLGPFSHPSGTWFSVLPRTPHHARRVNMQGPLDGIILTIKLLATNSYAIRVRRDFMLRRSCLQNTAQSL